MDDFIMKPKVDFAFKELMTNEKVRKGFLAAFLKLDPTYKSRYMDKPHVILFIENVCGANWAGAKLQNVEKVRQYQYT